MKANSSPVRKSIQKAHNEIVYLIFTGSPIDTWVRQTFIYVSLTEGPCKPFYTLTSV